MKRAPNSGLAACDAIATTRKFDPGLSEADGIGVATKQDKSDPGLSNEAGVVAGVAATKGKKQRAELCLPKADGIRVDMGVAATKGTSDPGLSEADGTGVVGDALLGFKLLSQQHGSDTGLVDQLFQVDQQLKDGHFSKVFLATHRTVGTQVVLKRYKTGVWWALLSEVLFLERCKHPNVVQLMDVFCESGQAILAFKFAGQPLFPLPRESKSWERREKAFIMKQVLLALACLHEKSVIHQDVRPSSILINLPPIHVCLSGFNHCRISQSGFDAQPWAAASLNYTAPELLLGCRSIDYSVDLWAFGVVLAQLFMGKPLMNEQCSKKVLKNWFKLLGSPSPEEVLILESYPSWRSQFAILVEAKVPLSRCGFTEDVLDLVQKLLLWSPGRPPEFKFEAILAKAIHMEFVL